MIVRGGDTALYHILWNAVTWSSCEFLGGGLNASPTATSVTAGHIDVFVIGTDNALDPESWDGTSWANYVWLGEQLTSGPAAASQPTSGQAHVFIRGPSSSVWRGVF